MLRLLIFSNKSLLTKATDIKPGMSDRTPKYPDLNKCDRTNNNKNEKFLLIVLDNILHQLKLNALRYPHTIFQMITDSKNYIGKGS